jgi:hypothetical protein
VAKTNHRLMMMVTLKIDKTKNVSLQSEHTMEERESML